MAEQASFLHVLRRCFAELYAQIDDLQKEITQLKLDDVGFDVEAPFDPWVETFERPLEKLT